MFCSEDTFLGFPRVVLAAAWTKIEKKKQRLKCKYWFSLIETHPAEVGSLHTADGGGENDEVYRPEVAALQAESPDFPGVEDGEEDCPLLLVSHHGAGDVQGRELSQAGPENVGVNSGQGNTEQPQLSHVGSSTKYHHLVILHSSRTPTLEISRKFN